jgi:hypothetical protein
MDIPFDPNFSPHYLILYNDGTSSSIPAVNMPDLIPKPTVNISDTNHLLPPFLHVGSKITFEKDGQYHKGYLTRTPEGSYRFSYKSHISKKHEDWGVPLFNLITMWQDLCTDGLLLPSHSWSSFDCTASAQQVSARNLLCKCPCPLLTALDLKHPDRDVWLVSFQEEKDGIKSLGTYIKIMLAEYSVFFVKKEPLEQFQQCASSQSRRTK